MFKKIEEKSLVFSYIRTFLQLDFLEKEGGYNFLKNNFERFQMISPQTRNSTYFVCRNLVRRIVFLKVRSYLTSEQKFKPFTENVLLCIACIFYS